MAVDPEHAQAVFLLAREHPRPADRAAVLERECLDNVELRQRVEELLGSHDTTDTFIGTAGRRFRRHKWGHAGGIDGRRRRGLRRGIDGRLHLGRDDLVPCGETYRSVTAASGDTSVPHSAHERPRHAHRPLQAAPGDRRRGHGRRLHGRAGKARPPPGRAQDHQARHGLRARSSPGSRPSARHWP